MRHNLAAIALPAVLLAAQALPALANPDIRFPNERRVDPPKPKLVVNLENGDFESSLDGWEKTGTAFKNQPTMGGNVLATRGHVPLTMPLGGSYWKDVSFPIGHKGKYWIGTFENRPNGGSALGTTQGDAPTGTLTSQPFMVASNYITFLIGGGNDLSKLTVELLVKEEGSRAADSYQPVATTARSGMNTEVMRREWWNVQALKGQMCRIRITDKATGDWGHINVDDIQLQAAAPPDTLVSLGATKVKQVVPYTFGTGAAKTAGYIDWDAPIWGFVDLHTHPMSHLGFGEQLFYGAPDGDPTKVLDNCNHFHGGYGLIDNQEGNEFRRSLVDGVENWKDDNGKSILDWEHKREGYPDFVAWPRWNSVLHQQMWHDWVKRAKDGGLRVMVALTVNSHCLADAAETKGPNDDLAVMNKQIAELKKFVGRHNDFMQIAESPAEMREIIRQDKLAVIIGTESDNIGNFYNPADKKGATFNPTPTNSQIKAEIDRLYNAGVRYIFPIHLTNNVFGGTAVYEPGVNVANKYNTGNAFEVETVGPETGISARLIPPYKKEKNGEVVDNNPIGTLGEFLMNFPGTILPGNVMPNNKNNYPDYPQPQTGGHRNRQGITPQGEMAIKYIMSKGMLIDIDHMSEKTAEWVLATAKSFNYPVNSGHNGFRESGHASENSRTPAQLQTIKSLGGMMGLGWGQPNPHVNYTSKSFAKKFDYAFDKMGGGQVAIGTDINGFYPAPGPRYAKFSILQEVTTRRAKGMVIYSDNLGASKDALRKCHMGNKDWDYSSEGFAHYGMFPDMLEELAVSKDLPPAQMSSFLNSSEDFAAMWTKCLESSVNVK